MYSEVAVAKTKKTSLKLILQGIMAGFMIGIGGYASQLVTVAGLPKVLSAAVFPVGLIMVILTGAELFTGNCLMPGALMNKKIKASGMAKVWCLSYIGNLIGSLLLAAGIKATAADEYLEIARTVAETKVSMSVPAMLIKGVLCNILVCIAVWCAIKANDTCGKAIMAFVPVFTFVFCGFEHSVANMYFLTVGSAPVGAMAFQILIVTIGNIIGGAIVGMLLEMK